MKKTSTLQLRYRYRCDYSPKWVAGCNGEFWHIGHLRTSSLFPHDTVRSQGLGHWPAVCLRPTLEPCIRKRPSPSPQISPLGKGGTNGSAGKYSLFSEYSQTVEGRSLSLRERARVRGNRAPDCIDTAKTGVPGCQRGMRWDQPTCRTMSWLP